MAKFPLRQLYDLRGADTSQINHRRPNKAGGPTINRGKGNNNAETPMVFIRPVEAKFGPLVVDLAASAANKRAPHYIDERTNSLTIKWHEIDCNLCSGGLFWLNPPFTNITPWARKCAEEVQLGAKILLLVPASVGANWYWDWVVPYADVYSVGRMVFDNCYDKHGKLITTPYPKDLILCHYEWRSESLRTGSAWLQKPTVAPAPEDVVGLIHRWRWQNEKV